jgi:flagellin
MSSILTNNSAMVALQTMKSISASLAKTTSDISTGKTVATAKDNAAVWAISKVMEADVQGFKGISDSLNLGSSTVAVARQAAETVTGLLTSIKGKIVAAQESNVDRGKIQSDIDAFVATIKSVVGGAQFNGLNLVDGSGSGTVSILSSLDRSGTTVTASKIDVTTQDLSIDDYVAKAVLTGSTGVSGTEDTAAFTLDATGGATTTGNIVIDDSAAAFVAGDSVSIKIGDKVASYKVTAADVASTTASDLVAVGLKKAVEALGITGLTVDYDSGTPGTIAFDNGGAVDLTVSAQFKSVGSGGLSGLAGIDVTTDAAGALTDIETMLQTAIDASASFGSAQTRIDSQKEFVTKLTDSMKAGIGSLVDADMEEASARLQALQVQQQLSTQALSIANQQPQSLLSLFR